MNRYLLVLGIILSGAANSAAEVLVLEPVADVSIFQDAAANASGEDFVLFVGVTQLGSPRRALLRFDLSDLPADAEIEAVTLTFRVERAVSFSDPHTLHRVTRAWNEGPAKFFDPNSGGSGSPAAAGDVTWLNAVHPGVAWTTPGGDYQPVASAATDFGALGSSPVFSGPGLIDDVELFRDDPAQNLGWIVIGNEAQSFNARRLHSREATSAPTRPLLEITYSAATVPESSDVWFLY